jgi:hypothetical protein
MRSVSTRVRSTGVILTLLVLLAVVPVANADGNPAEPPQARILPPIGATAQQPSFADLLWAWFMARIGPPIGAQ